MIVSRAAITPEAEEDLADIWAYIARDSERNADRFLRKLIETMSRLAAFPGMGPARDELAKGMRSFPVGNFVIFYLKSSEGIQVIRVLHGARDIGPMHFDR